MLKKYDSTVYFVEDIHNAAQWYADIVGTGVKHENEMYAYIETGDLKIGFHPEGKKIFQRYSRSNYILACRFTGCFNRRSNWQRGKALQRANPNLAR